MIETFALAFLIAAAIHLTRSHWPLVVSLWHEAAWWERALLACALMPIPGPVDEIAGMLVVRRVLARRRVVSREGAAAGPGTLAGMRDGDRFACAEDLASLDASTRRQR